LELFFHLLLLFPYSNLQASIIFALNFAVTRFAPQSLENIDPALLNV